MYISARKFYMLSAVKLIRPRIKNNNPYTLPVSVFALRYIADRCAATSEPNNSARASFFLSLSHNTQQKKTQSVGRRRRTRISVSLSLSCARLVPRARNRALAANTMQLILFIYLFAYFVLRARRVRMYINSLGRILQANNNNCNSHRDK